MYDKTLSAEQAIKKGTSKLNKEGVLSDEPTPSIKLDDIPEVPDIIKDSATEKEIEDLSFAVDDFIRHFSGESAKPAPSYPKMPTRRQQAERPNAQKIQKELQASTIPEEGELSGLMNDYIRIMNDEDDEPKFIKRLSLHKKKDRKKSGHIIEESLPEEKDIVPDEQEQPISIKLNEPDMFSIPSDFHVDSEPAPVQPSPASDFETEAQNDYYAEQSEQQEAEEESLHNAFEKFDEEDDIQEEAAHRSQIGRIIARTIFSILFVISFLATSAVVCINLVLNVNTGKEAPGGYYFFTAAYDYNDANVNAGDLVICKISTYLLDGTRAVYVYTDTADLQKKVSFGVKNGGMTDYSGNVVYLIGNQQIERENALGTIEKTVPEAGKIIDLVFDYYIIFVISLAILTVALFLITTVVLRNKQKAIERAEKKAEKKLSKQSRKASATETDDENAESDEAPKAEAEQNTESSDSDDEYRNPFDDLI